MIGCEVGGGLLWVERLALPHFCPDPILGMPSLASVALKLPDCPSAREPNARKASEKH